MKENVLREKSIDFSTRIIRLSQYLFNIKAYVLSTQILRSGTSIGANINEAQYAQSKADFISKMQISLKETAETEYWLILLKNTDYINEKEYISLNKDCLDIKRLLVASINTAKESMTV